VHLQVRINYTSRPVVDVVFAIDKLSVYIALIDKLFGQELSVSEIQGLLIVRMGIVSTNPPLYLFEIIIRVLRWQEFLMDNLECVTNGVVFSLQSSKTSQY
jgi:hypothetical protein